MNVRADIRITNKMRIDPHFPSIYIHFPSHALPLYEEHGLEGLIERRLGKESVRRVPVDRIAWMLEQYRTITWDGT